MSFITRLSGAMGVFSTETSKIYIFYTILQHSVPVLQTSGSSSLPIGRPADITVPPPPLIPKSFVPVVGAAKAVRVQWRLSSDLLNEYWSKRPNPLYCFFATLVVGLWGNWSPWVPRTAFILSNYMEVEQSNCAMAVNNGMKWSLYICARFKNLA